MTYDNPHLLEVQPTCTGSLYFRGSLHAVFNTLFKDSTYDFKAGTLNNDKDVMFVCRSILSGQNNNHRQNLKAAQITPEFVQSGNQDPSLVQNIASLKLAERQTRGALINLQALDIGSGVAQFVEEPLKGNKKLIYLPLVGSNERNEGLEIYARLWEHLDAYSGELNESHPNDTKSYSVTFDESNAETHFKELTIETKKGFGHRIARLGNVAVYGALQGAPEQPVGVSLALLRVPAHLPVLANV